MEPDISDLLILLDQIAQATDDSETIIAVGQMKAKLSESVLPSSIITQRITDLEDQIAILTTRLTPHQPDNGFYTIDQFITALIRKRGRSYGFRVDYVTASSTTPGCRAVKTEEFHKWQQSKEVPDWAYDQIDRLVFPDRKGKKGQTPWTVGEYDFLAKGYTLDPSKSNLDFAIMCTKEFGRSITEEAIKGALDRLRKRKRISKYRPKKGSGDTQQQQAEAA